jgi:hypothetical protein
VIHWNKHISRINKTSWQLVFLVFRVVRVVRAWLLWLDCVIRCWKGSIPGLDMLQQYFVLKSVALFQATPEMQATGTGRYLQSTQCRSLLVMPAGPRADSVKTFEARRPMCIRSCLKPNGLLQPHHRPTAHSCRVRQTNERLERVS